MTFEEVLKENSIEYLLEPRQFMNIKPYRAEVFADELRYLVSNRPKIYIIPDTDVDGVYTAKVMYDTIKTVIDIDIDVHIFDEKTHGITSAMVYETIKNHYTYVIILDSSTNNMEQIKMMTNRGIRVLVVDHHNSEFKLEDYPDGAVVFNSKMDISAGVRIPYSEASCGLLITLYCNYGLNALGYKMQDIYWLYATITLYSDVMDTLNPFNVMVINYARSYVHLDRMLSRLSGKKDNIPTRNVITFSINPKINACIRCGRMDLIYKLLFTDVSNSEEEAICKKINEINSEIKEKLSSIEGRLLFTEVMSVLLLDLTEYIDTDVIAFKGFLASKFSQSIGKVCIAYYIADGVVYGSVRDSLGRDIYHILRDYCFAEGHASALGIKLEVKYLEEMAKYLSFSLQDVEVETKRPIILEDISDEFTQKNIKDMGLCNEYTTTNTIGIKMKLDPYLFRITCYNSLYIIKSNKFTVKSGIPVNYGDTIIAVPTLGTQTELHLKTRCS